MDCLIIKCLGLLIEPFCLCVDTTEFELGADRLNVTLGKLKFFLHY